ncbi:MAG: hypothetical protein KGJ84_09895 [Elusimicrobia bacterium]|nr:hypothetical protein [Elusimicrobiota bacterium]
MSQNDDGLGVLILIVSFILYGSIAGHGREVVTTHKVICDKKDGRWKAWSPNVLKTTYRISYEQQLVIADSPVPMRQGEKSDSCTVFDKDNWFCFSPANGNIRVENGKWQTACSPAEQSCVIDVPCIMRRKRIRI